jgi:hypothetical protein
MVEWHKLAQTITSAHTGLLVRALEGQDSIIRCFRFSEDGTYLRRNQAFLHHHATLRPSAPYACISGRESLQVNSGAVSERKKYDSWVASMIGAPAVSNARPSPSCWRFCRLCADSGPSRTVIPTHCGQRSGDCGQLLMSV